MTEWLPEEDPLWYWSPARVISVLVALGYVLIACVTGNPKEALEVAAYLIIPVACIWFPEPIGDFTGSTGRGYVDQPSPEWAVSLMGWVLLLMPAFLALIVQLFES